jgi:flagellar protein FlaG
MDIRPVSNTPQSTPSPAPVEVKVTGNVTPNAPSILVDAVAAATEAKPAPTLAQITQAVNSINQAITAMSPDIQFSVDQESEQTIIKIVDQKTKEVLRQIPSVEALAIAKALDQAQGLLIKQKA